MLPEMLLTARVMRRQGEERGGGGWRGRALESLPVPVQFEISRLSSLLISAANKLSDGS